MFQGILQVLSIAACDKCENNSTKRLKQKFVVDVKGVKREYYDGTQDFEPGKVLRGYWCHPCAEKELIDAFEEMPDCCECRATGWIANEQKLCGERGESSSGCRLLRGQYHPKTGRITKCKNVRGFLKAQRASRKRRLNSLREEYGLEPKEYEDKVVKNEFYENELKNNKFAFGCSGEQCPCRTETSDANLV
ncbi:hypothetical protein BJ508DRAFT_315578 [Ascobolus immersus RN42]|uniref:Uncharacterized protein n=1 Tax=Ascobolus immersus RN42 TaxID=1160509 RepID=A0A3N4HA75_ASCIM|nr:hypothetical protein BJ508DRAFT_315578 [Ascobolus immersus RN42]